VELRSEPLPRGWDTEELGERVRGAFACSTGIKLLREPATFTDNLSQFLECADSVERYIQRRVRDRDVSAELLQDVSILLLGHTGAPPAGQTFEAWCHGIARNVVAHHFRSQRRQAALLNRAEPEGHTLLAQPPVDPEHIFATRELLDQMFANVDERSRRLMIERYLMGRSADELAEQADQSASAVRMKLMRVRGAVLKIRPKADSSADSGTSE
jgi:RNA polymerase sigma factor (sigma-70 family)